MLKSYEATLDHGKVQWLGEAPDVVKARIIVTVVEDQSPMRPRPTAAAVALSPVHRDPFDRLIIVTTLICQAKLASVDGSFGRYPELTDSLLTVG